MRFLSKHEGWSENQIPAVFLSVNRKVRNQSLTVNGPDDMLLERWIPTSAVDHYAATLSKWFGLSENEINTVFPNLSRFPGTYAGGCLGFMS